MIIDPKIHIAAASKVMFPLLTGRAPAYDKVLEWFQFAFTGDKTGSYVFPASTVLNRFKLFGVYPLFSPDLQKL